MHQCVCVFAHIYSLYLQGNEKDKKASNHTMIAPITLKFSQTTLWALREENS